MFLHTWRGRDSVPFVLGFHSSPFHTDPQGHHSLCEFSRVLTVLSLILTIPSLCQCFTAHKTLLWGRLRVSCEQDINARLTGALFPL